MEYGSLTLMESDAPSLLEGSRSVISSPNILEMFPRLISSMMKTDLSL